MRISDGSSDVCSSDLLLNNLADKADQLIIGGGIANTFLAAAGYKIGKSLCEMDMLDTARKIRDKIQARGGDIPLPEDVVCATEFSAEAHAVVRKIDEVEDDEMILDIGPKSRDRKSTRLNSSHYCASRMTSSARNKQHNTK